MERASVGSAMSSGNGLTWFTTSGFGFRSFLGLEEKKRGEKQLVGTAQDGWMQAGSMQAGVAQFGNSGLDEGWADGTTKGEVKVREHDVPVISDEDVFGLEVAVNDAQHVKHPSIIDNLAIHRLYYNVEKLTINGNIKHLGQIPFLTHADCVKNKTQI
ncbi:unnamed protein product [Spirodela intermedia]|nr:unnamed protein product [Spirodela intermedia]CAA6670106.1 unnamed protein product [Spirodela intermedia]